MVDGLGWDSYMPATGPARGGKTPAQVAKLVDALASGASDRKVMEVRVFSWAPNSFTLRMRKAGCRQARISGQGTTMSTIQLHKHDLPAGLSFGPVVAIDTETMGLDPRRDRLCLVQLSSGDGTAHLVQIIPPSLGGKGADCPNLKALLVDPAVTKLFHYARFDIAALLNGLGVLTAPVICTKIASKLVRTYTDRHGLKDLCRDLAGVEISKQQQTSDWGAVDLLPEQLNYAASDVLYLHAIWARLEALLVREDRLDIAQAAYAFLPIRARLDLLGYIEPDLFHH
jgi:ribonuclease D